MTMITTMITPEKGEQIVDRLSSLETCEVAQVAGPGAANHYAYE